MAERVRNVLCANREEMLMRSRPDAGCNQNILSLFIVLFVMLANLTSCILSTITHILTLSNYFSTVPKCIPKNKFFMEACRFCYGTFYCGEVESVIKIRQEKLCGF